MTTPDQTPSPTPALDFTPRADILRRFYRDGQNTCEIGKALDFPETVVVEIVRQERERRVEMYAGRRER